MSPALHPLVGTLRAGVTRPAVVVGAEVDSLAAEGAARVDERLVLLDRHDETVYSVGMIVVLKCSCDGNREAFVGGEGLRLEV